MGYKIKIKNRKGTFFSRNFKSKSQAKSVLKRNQIADRLINQGGLRKASTGRLIRIRNKYTLIKNKR
jgi:hypothetical protein